MKAPASSFVALVAAALIVGLPSTLIAGEELVLEEEAAPAAKPAQAPAAPAAEAPAAKAPAAAAETADDKPVLEVEGETAAPAKTEAPEAGAADAKPAEPEPAKAEPAKPEPQKAGAMEEALLEVEPAKAEPAKEEPAAAEVPAAKEPAAEAVEGSAEPAAGESSDELTIEEETPATPAAAAKDATQAPAVEAQAAKEPAAEAPAAEAPAAEAIAIEEPAAKETPPEPVKAEAPKPVPAPAAAEPDAAEAEAAAEVGEPSLDEEVGGAEEPSADTAEKESEVVVDEAQEEGGAPEAEAPKTPLPGIKIAGAPAAEPPPSFKIPGKERGFQEFLACGVPVANAASCQVSSVTGSPDADRYLAFRGTEVALTGKLKRGQVLAAYRMEQGSCLARYLGLVVVTGDGPRTAGASPASRGYVANSREPIVPGDGLCAYETVQKEYERQYAKEPRAGDGPVQGTIACIANGLMYLDTRQRTVLVDRGRKDGISPGWSCEFQAPGAGGRTTYGRVIRADESTCFVQFMRLCEPVEMGRQVVLSGARTRAASPSKRR